MEKDVKKKKKKQLKLKKQDNIKNNGRVEHEQNDYDNQVAYFKRLFKNLLIFSIVLGITLGAFATFKYIQKEKELDITNKYYRMNYMAQELSYARYLNESVQERHKVHSFFEDYISDHLKNNKLLFEANQVQQYHDFESVTGLYASEVEVLPTEIGYKVYNAYTDFDYDKVKFTAADYEDGAYYDKDIGKYIRDLPEEELGGWVEARLKDDRKQLNLDVVDKIREGREEHQSPKMKDMVYTVNVRTNLSVILDRDNNILPERMYVEDVYGFNEDGILVYVNYGELNTYGYISEKEVKEIYKKRKKDEGGKQ